MENKKPIIKSVKKFKGGGSSIGLNKLISSAKETEQFKQEIEKKC